MTLPQKDYYCNDCILTFQADYNDSVQRPRRACPKCHKVVDIKKSIVIPPQNASTQGKGELSPLTQISPILASMTDNELARHRLRMILTDKNTTNREVLDAVGKMTNYLDKAGQINIEQQSEKEVMDKFRQQPSMKLVSMLRKSSQKEP